MQLVAEKTTKDGKLWLRVFRNPDGTAHIIRLPVVKGLDAGEWDNDHTPEEWISLNGPRSQDRWQWTQS